MQKIPERYPGISTVIFGVGVGVGNGNVVAGVGGGGSGPVEGGMRGRSEKDNHPTLLPLCRCGNDDNRQLLQLGGRRGDKRKRGGRNGTYGRGGGGGGGGVVF